MAAVFLSALGISCHREPIEPTTSLDGSEITSEPIVENGEEIGYSLSYRSWIVPGDGGKSSTPEKGGGNSNDTVSVILHDTFYHVDTIAYVSTWDPDKYKQGNYTCHWDKYGLARPGENNVTITDSAIVLRVQFEEFSFQYRINFETATYRNGAIKIPFPHHTPVITDMGVEELESLETICRNDSVLARKVLRHSIKISVGNKNYILKANVMLHRHLPDANPNRYIVESILVPSSLQTYLDPDCDLNENVDIPLFDIDFTVRRRFSDQSIEEEPNSLWFEAGISGGMSNPQSSPLPYCPPGNTNGQIETEPDPDSGAAPPTDNPYIHDCIMNPVFFRLYHDASEGWQAPSSRRGAIPNTGYYDDGVLWFRLPQLEVHVEYIGTHVDCDGTHGTIYDTIRGNSNGINYYKVISKEFNIQ